MSRRSWWVVVLAALAALVVGCSSDKSGKDTVPLPSSTSTALISAPTTASSPTSTAAPTTPPAPTTVATTSPTTTTEAPTTQTTEVPGATTVPVDPKAAIEAQVRTVYAADQEAWKVCLTLLPNCDDTPFAATEDGPALRQLRTKIRERNDNQIHARNVDGYRYSIQTIDVMDSLESAQLIACIDDPVVLFTVDAPGVESIVDNTHSSRLESLVARPGSDGSWRFVSAAVGASSANGELVCAV